MFPNVVYLKDQQGTHLDIEWNNEIYQYFDKKYKTIL